MDINNVVTISIYAGLGISFLCSFLLIMGPDRKNITEKYDERQIIARNQAYKSSFILLLVYLMVCVFLDIAGIQWATASAMLFIGIMVSITLFVNMCIIKDAYNGFLPQKNKKRSLIGSMTGSAFNAGYIIYKIVFKRDNVGFFTDHMINSNIFFILWTLLFFSSVITYSIKTLINKRAEKE